MTLSRRFLPLGDYCLSGISGTLGLVSPLAEAAMEVPAMPADYVLGYTSLEQQRLIRQARVLAPLTQRFLRDAGICSGMRVLDIGCGMGDVTMIAAQLVGTAGHVTSIDLDQASIETAQRRSAAFGFENTSFHRADIAEYVFSSPFDAIIGRLVLEFVPDPIAIIKRLYGRAVSWHCRNPHGNCG
jgi:ubiquinone/menaquinone biosynthesis C-methylase UbiE